MYLLSREHTDYCFYVATYLVYSTRHRFKDVFKDYLGRIESKENIFCMLRFSMFLKVRYKKQIKCLLHLQMLQKCFHNLDQSIHSSLSASLSLSFPCLLTYLLPSKIPHESAIFNSVFILIIGSMRLVV